jgi:hypothetical protein
MGLSCFRQGWRAVVYALAFLIFQLVDGREGRETEVMGMARCIYRLRWGF